MPQAGRRRIPRRRRTPDQWVLSCTAAVSSFLLPRACAAVRALAAPATCGPKTPPAATQERVPSRGPSASACNRVTDTPSRIRALGPRGLRRHCRSHPRGGLKAHLPRPRRIKDCRPRLRGGFSAGVIVRGAAAPRTTSQPNRAEAHSLYWSCRLARHPRLHHIGSGLDGEGPGSGLGLAGILPP